MTTTPHVDGVRTRLLARVPGRFGLPQVPVAAASTSTTRVVCGFCSTGCGLDLHLQDGVAVNLTPANDHPVNRGMACPKGWEALTPLDAPNRATTPLLRDAKGHLVPTSWNEALGEFVRRGQSIQAEHGPGSLAFLSTGQITTEEMALLGAVAKFGMGMVHGDGNTRQCMATSVVAYKQAFGFDAPPYTYADFEASDVIVLIGSNLAIAHPIMWERVLANPNDPTVVVIDPRRTETAAAATIHVAPTPKSDLSLLYGLGHVLVRDGFVDADFVAAHVDGFDGYAAHVAAFTPERVADDTGLEAAAIVDLAHRIGRGRAVSLWWTMGISQSHQGVRTSQAIIDIALITVNIGRPGTGANSVTGQCNAMGSRLFSNTASLYAGRDTTDAADRAEVAEILELDVDRIPDQPSWAYDRIVEGIHRGEIRGLWIVATNSAHSWINHTDLHDLLDTLDLLVVQDLYATTETARLADIVLPAAGWAEKDGSFINSERRFGLVKKVRRAPGLALADFWIFRAVADAWGCGDLFAEWSDPEAAFALLQRLSAGRPCDITGIAGYEHLDSGEVQWPWPTGGPSDDDDPIQRRLFADGRFFTPNGRANLLFEEPVPPAERPNSKHPLVLLTGRGSAAQWHTGTRTDTSAVLRSLAPETAWVEIHPEDATARGIATADRVVVWSARGSMSAVAHVVCSVQPGQVFIPMHDPHVNRLTFPSFDPMSRQPSYKYSAVEVRAVHPWES